MATATAFSTVLDELLDSVRHGPALEDALGIKLTGCTVNAGATFTTTHPEMNRLGANTPSGRLQGWYAYAVADAEERMITTVASSAGICTVTVTLAFTGEAAATVYITRVPISVLLNHANIALSKILIEGMIPLYHGPDDADLQDSDTVDASWAESNATDTVQTTDAEVWQGARSLVVTDSGSGGGYTRSGVVRMGQGARGTAFAIAKSDAGTSALRVNDQGGTALETVPFTQEEWLFIKKPFGLASDDEGCVLDLLESTASAAGDWQFAWVVKEGNGAFRLPEHVDRYFRVKGVARAIFREPGSEADTWLADSVEFESLRRDSGAGDGDYRFNVRHADANPNWVYILNRSLLTEPLFLILDMPASAPYGVAAALTTLASTSLVPQAWFVAYMKYMLGDFYPSLKPGLKEEGLQQYRSLTRREQNGQPRRIRRVIGMFS